MVPIRRPAGREILCRVVRNSLDRFGVEIINVYIRARPILSTDKGEFAPIRTPTITRMLGDGPHGLQGIRTRHGIRSRLGLRVGQVRDLLHAAIREGKQVECQVVILVSFTGYDYHQVALGLDRAGKIALPQSPFQ